MSTQIEFIRLLVKRLLILTIPFLLLGISVVAGETACDDAGTDPSGSRLSLLDPCD